MYRITLTAGTMFDATGNLISPEARDKALKRIREMLAVSAGGFTEQDSFGGWIKDGQVVSEPGKRWTILTGSDSGASTYAQLVGNELHQNAVALEVENLAEARIVEMDHA